MVIELIGLDFDINISDIKFDVKFLTRGLEPAHSLHCSANEWLNTVSLSQDWRRLRFFGGNDARNRVDRAAKVHRGFFASLEICGKALDALYLRLSNSLLF